MSIENTSKIRSVEFPLAIKKKKKENQNVYYYMVVILVYYYKIVDILGKKN